MTIKKLIILIIGILNFANSSAQYTKLLDFSGALDGSWPNADLLYFDPYLYGMTTGSPNEVGTIFKIKPDGTDFTKLFEFSDSSNGIFPLGSLISDGLFLYGMTSQGGDSNIGTVFKINSDGTGFTKLLDFGGVLNGNFPMGSLISDGIFLYGTTYAGGLNNYGVIFKIKKDGTGYTKLLDFESIINGGLPEGSLYYDGVFLYGTTRMSAWGGMGSIFKIKPDGSDFTTIHKFDITANGTFPTGSLISDSTFLYGMTKYGGVGCNPGTIFKIKKDGTNFTKLHDFGGWTDGISPKGSLISDGTFLFGMTPYGGANDKGTIFKIKFDGTGYTKILEFSGLSNGSEPYGSLISEGTTLYGMTTGGGVNAKGTIFKVSKSPTNTLDFINISKFSAYPNPFTSIVKLSSFSNCIGSVKVYNMLGIEVCSHLFLELNHEETFNLSSLTSGIYFIKVNTKNNDINTIKMIKK